MHASLADAAILSLVLLVFVAGIRVWAEIVRRRRQGIPAVAYEPRRPVPWTAAEIALILAVYLLLQIAAVPVVFGLMGLEVRHATDDSAESKESAEPEENAEPKEMDPQRYTAMLLANVLGNVLTAAATVALLRLHAAPQCRLRLGGVSWWPCSHAPAPLGATSDYHAPRCMTCNWGWRPSPPR